jgi:alanine racemase
VSRAEALINLDAIRGNVATLKRATPAEVMAVVKADGYGHGLLPVARAALAGGATWLGTAIIDEALLLRAA